MSKFEELMDELMIKAREAAGVATKKTGEVVEIGRLSYQIKQTQWDVEKLHARLGSIVYEARKNPEENYDEVIDLAVNEIDLLNAKIKDLEERLRACKGVSKCPVCGKENDLSHVFCSRCGAVLEMPEEDVPQEDTPPETGQDEAAQPEDSEE